MTTASTWLEDARLLGECEQCGGLVPVTVEAVSAKEDLSGQLVVNFVAKCCKHGSTQYRGQSDLAANHVSIRLRSVQ